MSICVACTSWLVKALEEGLSDVLYGCRTGMQFATNKDAVETQVVVAYEAPFRHSYKWILQHKRWCWACCHLWFFSGAKFEKTSHKVKVASDGKPKTEPCGSDVLAGFVRVVTDHISVWQARKDATGRTSNARVLFRCDSGPELYFELCDDSELATESPNTLRLLVARQDSDLTILPSVMPQDKRCDFGESSICAIEDVREQSSLVRTWLDECLSSHTDCRKRWHGSVADDDRPPTRLIRVGTDDSQIQLVETARLNKSTIEYATLSHMWGKEAFEQLTLGNYQASLARLSPSSLPRTFREAILFCRRLRIDYIWIDSLCIIQDSAADWDIESVLMHHVYGGSLINLAATASSSPAQGLFRPYQPLLGRDLILLLPGAASVRSKFDWNVNYRWSNEYNQDAPLLKRGWVLQECLLAARVLHFTDRGLLFTCNKEQKTDTKVPIGGMQARYNFRDASIARRADDVDSVWESIMRSYSDASLTVAGDRVVALAGAAAFMHAAYSRLETQTWYTAGCWEHNIVIWLHWYFMQGVKTPTDRPGLALPSWSWLTSRGRLIEIPALWTIKQIIEWCDKGEGHSLRLLRAHRRNVDLNAPFGFLGSTSLLVETFVFDLVGHKFVDVVDRSHATKPLWADDGGDREGFTSVPVPKLLLPRCVGLYLDAYPVGLEALHCALLSGVFNDAQHNLCYLSYALVLQDTGELKEGLRQYRRLGVMVMDRRKMKDTTRLFFNRKDLPYQQFWLV